MPVLPTSGHPFGGVQLSRRGFIGAGIASGFALAGCHSQNQPTGRAAMADAIAAAEAARPHSGRTVTANLTPQHAVIDLGGPTVHTLCLRQRRPRTPDPRNRW
ncbi:Multicopper oxidase MmcO [Mycobacterium simulans]|nr:Multicopper oxidase MmcO [Mycobacterium simulans]